MKSETLHVHGFFGTTFWLTVILVLVLYGVGEWTARSERFQRYLTYPRLGSRHSQLGYKLALLNEVKKKGPIDCIAIGSSIVDVGFDPDSFQEGYRATTGREIQCFNFGIDASSSISASVLAEILIEDYHPRLLIFGTDARDYAVAPEDRDTAVVLDTPWIKYRQGHFSLEGWLQEHSYLYRYRQHLSQILRFHFEGTLRSYSKSRLELRPNGYNPDPRIAKYINAPPAPDDESYEVVYYRKIYSSYHIRDDNLAALETIMKHNRSDTHVIVVEMPISDGLYYFFGNGETDYLQFIARVNELARHYKIPFWQTEPLNSIPDNGWSDYGHLNVIGAKIFSTWLGQRIGDLDG